MSEFETGKKIGEFEARISVLEEALRNLGAEDTEHDVAAGDLEGVGFFFNADGDEITADEYAANAGVETSGVWRSGNSIKLAHGKTGFPKFRNYNTISGSVWMTLDGAVQTWAKLESGMSEGKGSRYPKTDSRWNRSATNTSHIRTGFRGRQYGSHRLYSGWARFLDSSGWGYIVHWSY